MLKQIEKGVSVLSVSSVAKHQEFRVFRGY
jgi:hypothetical protein